MTGLLEDGPHDLLIDLDIFHHENATRNNRPAQNLGLVGHNGRSFGPLQSDREPESRLLPFCTLDADAVSHQLDQTPGDRQPEPSAPELTVNGAVDVAEAPEQPFLLVLRNSDAGIPHHEANCLPVLDEPSCLTINSIVPARVNFTASFRRLSRT
jgi:hypothetical protein